jgi:MinD superfamily P-loop ATPase
MENNKNLKLVILSGKGGVGKSMLASALAMLFSQGKN